MKGSLSSLIVILFVASSCVSSKKIIYLQDIEGVFVNNEITIFEPKIQIGDILSINVSAIDAESALPFNLYEIASITNPKLLTYLVNFEGKINFPILGRMLVKGLTTGEITKMITQKLKNGYLKNPIVNLRLINFKITVIGEVEKPGTFTIENERISIIEAIGLAGGLTIKGKRKNIKILREQDGKRTIETVDITNKEIFNSHYFYLSQNDVIIIEPNQSHINSSIIGPNTGIIFSAIASLISIIALIIRF